MNESPYPLIAIQEAWRRIADALSPLAPRRLSLDDALGCVLAEDVTAEEDLPPFPASAMDGYAVVGGDPARTLRVVGELHAGSGEQLVVTTGQAARIMTGASLPRGADAVIPVEQTESLGDQVRLLTPVSAGQHVRPAGQDAARGDVLLDRGLALGAPEIGLLAALGRLEVLVHPRPRVAILATGDELIPPGGHLGPGQIRDSNSLALTAAVRAAGFSPISLGIVPDVKERLRDAILEGVANADMLLTSGGVSMGNRDYVKPLLAELGTVHFGRVATKPGKPLTFAHVKGVPVFGLPGFPVSSLVSFENFVRPALRLLAGHRRLWRPEVTALLAHDVAHAPDRTDFQRATLHRRDGRLWATTTGSQSSSRLKSLVGADALLRLLPSPETLKAGEAVDAILIGLPEGREEVIHAG